MSGWIVQMRTTGCKAYFVDVLRVERRNADSEFVQQNAQTPPVDCLVVTHTADDFRRQILGGTTESVGRLVITHVLSRERGIAVQVSMHTFNT